MKKSLFLVGLLIVVASFTMGRTVMAQDSKAAELNTVLMNSTFEIEDINSQGQILSSGTAFVMGRPYPDGKKERYVLITAAHVLQDMQGNTATVFFRVKVDENTWAQLPFPIPIRSNGQPLWTKHPEADVAVMYIRIPASVSIPLVSTDLLADDSMLSRFEIHPGDELTCLGYPLRMAANDACFPILRSGKIASYPLLPTKTTKTFLFDFRVFKGNSGGPVYFEERDRSYDGLIHIGETVHFIVGLISEERLLDVQTPGVYSSQVQEIQLGLAVVVFSSLIKEAINMLPAVETEPE